MIRTFSTLVILAALAGPAAAQDVTVSLAGKSARTATIDIERAAWSVCRQAYLKSVINFADQADCARGLTMDALAQADGREPVVAAAPSSTKLASNDAHAPSNH
jgi:hypothetical protein